MTPVKRPIVLCTSRLTNSGSGASPAIWCMCSSKPIARSTWGSPNTQAKLKASRPATTPASMPLTSRALTIVGSPKSVAGKAEQMPPVVDEFVDIHAGEDRGRPLFRADEIERQKENQPAKDRPGQDFANRNGNRR